VIYAAGFAWRSLLQQCCLRRPRARRCSAQLHGFIKPPRASPCGPMSTGLRPLDRGVAIVTQSGNIGVT
jgi:hypothetical protein